MNIPFFIYHRIPHSLHFLAPRLLERLLVQWVGFDVEIAILHDRGERQALVETIRALGLRVEEEDEQ